MFSIAIDLINAARASKMSPEDIEQNPLLQCAELFQWQDFVAIDNGTHPLWTAYDYDVTRLCVRAADALRELRVQEYRTVLLELFNAGPDHQPFIRSERFGSERMCKLTTLELIDIQRDAASSFACLGPLGHHSYVCDPVNGVGTAHLGWGINVRSRQYFIDGWHQTSPDGAQFIYDNLNKVFVTRRAILTLEDVHGERMLTCSFLPEREDWLEVFCAMYTKVYAVGPTNIKWQELG